jgi:squalene synthase HpnC
MRLVGPMRTESPGLQRGPAPAAGRLQDRERAENFPVALSVLPKSIRTDLHAVYVVARTIDDLGDLATGDRNAALHDFQSDLHEIWRTGAPGRPVLQALARTVRTRRLSAEPFDRLIEANLIDQRINRYATFDDLLGYCRLSADPVGRLLLDLFGQSSPVTRSLSDRVCRALQLLEHWQDIGEDRRAGRVYVPQEDLRAFGVQEGQLDEPHASAALRDLILFETNRAARLLESGAPLLAHLRGWARLAVTGYIAGGRAAARGLRRTGGDVLGRAASTRRGDVFVTGAALIIWPPKPGRTNL